MGVKIPDGFKNNTKPTKITSKSQKNGNFVVVFS